MKQLFTCRYLLILLIAVSCANQGAPPGGPVDNIPPKVISTTPAQDSLHVPVTTNVQFLFSEKIDSRSVVNSVFVSPNPASGFEIDVKGDKLRLQFADSLGKNLTYTITLGTDIRDLRSNRMKESYTLAFSTGDHLDKNQINGKVFAEKPNEVTVWAYFLQPDSVIDPYKHQPNYITQCDDAGNFRLFNLAPRAYRLFAVSDRSKNHLYEPGQDLIGLTFGDIELFGDSIVVKDRYFRLMKEDTSQVKVLQIDQVDRHHLRLRFSQPIVPMNDSSPRGELFNQNGETCEIYHIEIDEKNANLWFFNTATRDSGEYQLNLFSAMDLFGRQKFDSLEVNFTSTAKPDTTPPILQTISPQDSSRNMLPDATVKVTFNEAVVETDSSVFQMMMNDSIMYHRFKFRWQNQQNVEFYPDSFWKSLTWYSIILDTSRIADVSGNRLEFEKDKSSFQVIDVDTLGAISGTVRDEDSLAHGSIFLELWQAGGKEASQELKLPGAGEYHFPYVLPGEYIVKGFRDKDGNHIYSMGNVNPFVPAERFFVAQDTIHVRSRWPNEGNDYWLKR